MISAIVLVAVFGVIRGSFARRAIAFPEETHDLALRMYLLQLLGSLTAIAVVWTFVVRWNPSYILLLVAGIGYTLFFVIAALGGLIGIVRLKSGRAHDEFRSIRQERMRAMTPEQQRAEAAEEERLRRGVAPPP